MKRTKRVIAAILLLIGASPAAAQPPPAPAATPFVLEDLQPTNNSVASPGRIDLEDLQEDGTAVAQAIAIAPDGTRVVATAVARRGGFSRSVAIGQSPSRTPAPQAPNAHPFLENGVVHVPTPPAR